MLGRGVPHCGQGRLWAVSYGAISSDPDGCRTRSNGSSEPEVTDAARVPNVCFDDVVSAINRFFGHRSYP